MSKTITTNFVALNDEERTYLQKYVTTGKNPAQSVTRARILLLADQKVSDIEIAKVLQTSKSFKPLTGQRIISITKHRRRKEYAEFMKEIVEVYYKDADIIRLVQDNLNTHNGGSFYETFDAETAQRIYKKFEYHFTPKKASWLNMVEFEFSAISRQCLKRRIGEIETLKKETAIIVKQRNEIHTKVNWKFSKNVARKKFKRFYINDNINN